MPETLKVQLNKTPAHVQLVRGLSVLSPDRVSRAKVNPDAAGSDLDRLMESAHQSGYDDAEKVWTARLSDVLQRLDQEAAMLETCREELLSSFGPSVIDLAVSVAEKFLVGEQDRRAYSIKAIVESVMAKMEMHRGPFTVNLNPVDLEAVGEVNEILGGEAVGSIRLAEDPEMPLASCRVDT